MSRQSSGIFYDRALSRDACMGVLLTLFCLAVAALASEFYVKKLMGVLYSIQVFGLLFLCIRTVKKRPVLFLSPSFLFLAYVGVTVCIGAFVFSGNYALQIMWLDQFWIWEDIHSIYACISVSFGIFFLLVLHNASSPSSSINRYLLGDDGEWGFGQKLFVTFLLAFLTLGFLTIGSNSLEKPSSFIDLEIFPMVIAVSAIYAARKSPNVTFWILVLAMILLISLFSAHNKRAAIFIMFPAVFVFMQRSDVFKIQMRTVLVGLLITGLLLYFIAAMSLTRGYGGYEGVSFIEALALVPDYMTSIDIIGSLANNLEASYMFYVLHDSVNLSTVEAVSPLEYGATYLKLFFVGIPESLLGYKPESIISSYTSFTNPYLRSIGGSLPPTALGEVFWNFGYWGLFILPIIVRLLDLAYSKICKIYHRSTGFASSVLVLITIELQLQYIRGSGLDMMLAYLLLALPYVAVGAGLYFFCVNVIAGANRRVLS